MKNTMIKLMVLSAVVIGLNASHASACTVLPVNELAQKNDLMAQALTHLQMGVDNTNIEQITISDYYGDYVWTPMCPRGILAGGVVTITWKQAPADWPEICEATVKVEKSYYYDEEYGLRYDIETINDVSCTALPLN